MPPEELTLILKLRDEATKGLKSWRAGIVAAGAAVAAVGFQAGADWDKATKTIVEGTGATGEALAGLQKDYQAVAKYGDGAATAIADLNTHLGLEGEELQTVAAAALKAKVNTNLFGDVAAQMGLDVEGTTGLLDDLVTVSQNTGVGVDQLTQTIGKNSARFQVAGGSVEDLTALVAQAADEFGPSGLRGAMSEIMEAVDRGVIPAVESLEAQLGDTTGAVERTYEAGKTWRDTLRETKDSALAYIGPAGDMLGVMGSTVTSLALAGPQMLKWIKGLRVAAIGQAALNLVMNLNPFVAIGTAIVITGLAIWKFRDQILGFLSGAWNKLKSAVSAAAAWLSPLTSLFGGTTEKVAELSDELAGHSLTSALQAVQVKAEETTVVIEELDWSFDQLRSGSVNSENAMSDFIKNGLQPMKPLGIEAAMAVRELNTEFDALPGNASNSQDSLMGAIGALEKFPAAAEPVVKEAGKNIAMSFSEQFSARLARTFESGGTFTDAFKSQLVEMGQNLQGALASKLSGVLNLVPVVGPLLAQFAPALMAGIGKLAGKVWGGIKSLFGGPDGIEMEGREAAADARDAIASTLTDGQIKEAAGNMANAVHIAVRDATLGAGGTIEMAERTATEMVKLLHAAEKDGVGAVMAAQQAIMAILNAIPKTITTVHTTVHRDVYESSGSPSSDVFRPSQIDPNRASPSQPAIKVVAVVPRDAVTDAMLQNAPRRQALHGTA